MNSEHNELIDVECPFRVEAGPGSGKTRWLADHVRRTIALGTRLNTRTKVACITYTQVGTDTLKSRLGESSDRVWISTIHSFLYHQLVRPYAYCLGIPELNTASFDGHAPLRPRSSVAMAWLEALGLDGKYWYSMDLARTLAPNLENALEWSRQADGTWKLGFAKRANWMGIRHPRLNPKDFYNKHEPLLAYKKSYWIDGRINHDDVLYLAHRLLTERPSLRAHVAQRFPYIFLDEYQDTTPAQADIVDYLAAVGAVVGVIGDIGQAIFSFTGADPACYRRFQPPQCQFLTLVGNWRSTPPIVRVLNNYRSDALVQVSQHDGVAVEEHPLPCIIIGALADGYAEAKRRVANGVVHLIGRSHAQVTELMGVAAGRAASGMPWDGIEKIDPKRTDFLRVLCRAASHTRASRHHDAISEFGSMRQARGRLVDPFKGEVLQRLRFRALTVLLLREFLRALATEGETALSAYRTLEGSLDREDFGVKLKRIRDSSEFARAAAAIPIKNLIDTVQIDTPTGVARTIHAYKGDEADSIFLYIDGDRLVTQLHSPTNCEDARLLYVALSRARRRLFVSIPSMEQSLDAKCEAMGYTVIRLHSAQAAPLIANGRDEEDVREHAESMIREAVPRRKAQRVQPQKAKAHPPKGNDSGQGSLF